MATLRNYIYYYVVGKLSIFPYEAIDNSTK